MRGIEGFKLLQRAKLRESLERADEVPLSLVMAPMGYGKSTAVRNFVRESKKEHIWISLGRDSVSEEWLWNRITDEFKSVDIELCEQMGQMLLPQEKAEEDMFVHIMHSRLSGFGLYIVIDDYHLCNGDTLNRLFTKLAYEDIPGLHIVLISRGNIELPYEELFLKNYCRVTNRSDLAFTKEEIDEFFRLNGVELDSGELDAIYGYSDGWAAAVSLLWHNYMKNGSLCMTESVLGLLRGSVYAVLEPEERRLLSQMSLFNEFSLDGASAVLGKKVSAHTMEKLMQKTGLIDYNITKKCFLMHSMLCQVAGEELDVWHIDEHDSYVRYARYLESKGDIDTAFKYYMQAGESDEVFRVIEREDFFDIIESVQGFLHDFFDDKQNQILSLEHPKACLSYIYFAMIASDARLSDKVRSLFELAKEHYDMESGSEVVSELLVIEAMTHFNDLKKINSILRRVIVLKKGKPSAVFWKRIFSYGVVENLLMYHRTKGKLRETLEEEKEYSRNYMRLAHNMDRDLSALMDSEYLLETGNVDRAAEMAEVALEIAEMSNHICGIISSCMVILRGSIICGDKQRFQKTIERCRAAMEGINRPTLVFDFDQMIGYVYALTGSLEKVPLWLREGSFDNCNMIVRDSRVGCIIYGTFLCRRQKWARLCANAERMLVPYAGTKHVFAEIFGKIYLSIAYWNMGASEIARSEMKNALELCECDSIKLPFAELSFCAEPILKSLAAEVPYAREVLPLCERWLNGVAAFKDDEYTVAEFTPREIALIKLLTQGYRNSEIGQRLNIAQVTVEKNLTNIYRKIGVTNRTSALSWINRVYKL